MVHWWVLVHCGPKKQVLNANKAYTMCTPYTKWENKNFNFLLITNPVAHSYQYFNSDLQICILQAKGERRAIAQSPSTWQFQHKREGDDAKRIGLGFNHWLWFIRVWHLHKGR
jgi:hypothetical protein